MTDLTSRSALEVGKALRARRTSLGLTREQVAQRIGVSGSLVTRMENADVDIDIVRFSAWCTALGLRCEVSEIADNAKMADDGA